MILSSEEHDILLELARRERKRQRKGSPIKKWFYRRITWANAYFRCRICNQNITDGARIKQISKATYEKIYPSIAENLRL
jgi:hypothetical protein